MIFAVLLRKCWHDQKQIGMKWNHLITIKESWRKNTSFHFIIVCCACFPPSSLFTGWTWIDPVTAHKPLENLAHTCTHTYISCSILIFPSPRRQDGLKLITPTRCGHMQEKHTSKYTQLALHVHMCLCVLLMRWGGVWSCSYLVFPWCFTERCMCERVHAWWLEFRMVLIKHSRGWVCERCR